MGWTRLPPRNCFYYKSPRHGGQYLLSFVFTFGGDENEVYDFAYTFPIPTPSSKSTSMACKGAAAAVRLTWNSDSREACFAAQTK